jgi:AcrR family transcriptional regulator
VPAPAIPQGKSLLRRHPKQDRSRERVDEILTVAIRLIGEKGIDAVTMKEVAHLSGGPIASVYQYFPNKSAVIATLYERYNRDVGTIIADCLSGAQSVEALHEAVQQLLDRYYEMMKGHPALLDLVNAVHADKALQSQDIEQTEALVDEFFLKTHHLFATDARPQYRRTLFLLFQLTSSTVRMSLAMPEPDGEELFKEFADLVHMQLDRIAGK